MVVLLKSVSPALGSCTLSHVLHRKEATEARPSPSSLNVRVQHGKEVSGGSHWPKYPCILIVICTNWLCCLEIPNMELLWNCTLMKHFKIPFTFAPQTHTMLSFQAEVLELRPYFPIRASSVNHEFLFLLFHLILTVMEILPSFYKWRDWGPGPLSRTSTKPGVELSRSP